MSGGGECRSGRAAAASASWGDPQNCAAPQYGSEDAANCRFSCPPPLPLPPAPSCIRLPSLHMTWPVRGMQPDTLMWEQHSGPRNRRQGRRHRNSGAWSTCAGSRVGIRSPAHSRQAAAAQRSASQCTHPRGSFPARLSMRAQGRRPRYSSPPATGPACRRLPGQPGSKRRAHPPHLPMPMIACFHTLASLSQWLLTAAACPCLRVQVTPAAAAAAAAQRPGTGPCARCWQQRGSTPAQHGPGGRTWALPAAAPHAGAAAAAAAAAAAIIIVGPGHRSP